MMHKEFACGSRLESCHFTAPERIVERATQQMRPARGSDETSRSDTGFSFVNCEPRAGLESCDGEQNGLQFQSAIHDFTGRKQLLCRQIQRVGRAASTVPKWNFQYLTNSGWESSPAGTKWDKNVRYSHFFASKP